MAEFKSNVPVIQADPNVTVDVTAASPLPIGKHRFSLVVVDDSGNESAPFLLDIVVRDGDRPTAVLEMVDRNNNVIPPIVNAGQSFILSGKGSKDLPPGKIKEYRFTLLSPSV